MINFEELKKKYTPIIDKLLIDNEKFYQFSNKTEWRFIQNEDKAIIAHCDNNLVININIVSIAYMEEVKQPHMLEYYLLHEIRHKYQRMCVNNNQPVPTLEIWRFEFKNYITMYQDIDAYYNQSIEFDAFAFSYAVMLYKYGKIDYINPPERLKADEQFNYSVQIYIEHFRRDVH